MYLHEYHVIGWTVFLLLYHFFRFVSLSAKLCSVEMCARIVVSLLHGGDECGTDGSFLFFSFFYSKLFSYICERIFAELHYTI